MESKTIKIKVKPESLTKNMFVRIESKEKSVPIQAYFKKFMIKDKNNIKGQYRDTVQQILNDFPGIPQDNIYLFMTDNKNDNNPQGTFVKYSSIQLKDVSEIRLLPPDEFAPFVRFLSQQIADLQRQIRDLSDQTSSSNSKKAKKQSI